MIELLATSAYHSMLAQQVICTSEKPIPNQTWNQPWLAEESKLFDHLLPPSGLLACRDYDKAVSEWGKRKLCCGYLAAN